MGIHELVDAISQGGGRPILVGGSVRDMVMAGKTAPWETTSDYDIEVFGLTLDELRRILARKNFRYDEVGEHFAVLKVHVDGLEHPVDVSLPRREKSTGDGHRSFDVVVDPSIAFKDAAARRDFTINALGYDFVTGELLDPHGGLRDIQQHLIYHISGAFAEDPLRPLRAARFASRFDFVISVSTFFLCAEMRPLADSLPSERIWTEIEKAVHESQNLGDFFWFIWNMRWIDLFPEVAALIGVPQDEGWHPEGDVFTHTMHALNYWSQNLRTGNKEDDLITAIAILCHDFGKATTTEMIDGRWCAHGHEEAGVPLVESFLHRLRQYELAKEVAPLVANHLAPCRPFTKRSVRRMTTKVKRMDLLCVLSRADNAGRPPRDYAPAFKAIDEFEQAWRELDVPIGGPKPLVGGDYLIELGVTPGPIFKEILGEMYEHQLDGSIWNEATAKWWVRSQVARNLEQGKLK